MNTIKLERNGPVGWLRLNRPDKLNAFTFEMWDELRILGEELHDDDELRALVVIGEGRAFSSGIDTSVFSGGAFASNDGGAESAESIVEVIQRAQGAFNWLEEVPFATIAAVRGYALGAGLQMALACDLRVIARGAKVGLLELRYGLLPDLGGTQRLPRLIGSGKAKELIFSGAQIDAEEAFRLGIAERIVDEAELESHVGELAQRIAAQPPLAVRGAKRAVNAASEVSRKDGLLIEAEQQAVCLRSADMAEAIAAFIEQRTPHFQAK